MQNKDSRRSRQSSTTRRRNSKRRTFSLSPKSSSPNKVKDLYDEKRVYGFSCFGNTRRFNNIGYHPGLDRVGRDEKLPPGHYTYDYKPACSYKALQKPAWKRAAETEEFSKNLGYRNAEILHYRAFMANHLGPGSHDIIDDSWKPVDSEKCSGFGTQEKFVEYPINKIPGPGTYFYNVKGRKIVPSIQFSQDVRFKDEEKPWWIPPNCYEIKSSLRQLMDKVVSKRGPYDLFSGDRSDPNTYNKFAIIPTAAPDKIYYIPSQLDYLLYDKQKRRTGKFYKSVRFPKKPTVRMMLNDLSLCYKNPKFPGPGRYTLPGGIKTAPEAMYYCGASQMEIRPTRWTIFPGPGRYNVKYPKCKEPKESWIFKSKTQRTEYKAPVYNAF